MTEREDPLDVDDEYGLPNWHSKISAELKRQDETWDDVNGHTMNDEELYRRFNDDWGLAEGCPFTLWTKNRVYFPGVYDGLEWVASVPRNPCKEATKHVGSE